MSDMTVEEAVQWLEEHYHDFKWFPHTSKALRVILDELKRLQNQPERAYLREGEWCQK